MIQKIITILVLSVLARNIGSFNTGKKFRVFSFNRISASIPSSISVGSANARVINSQIINTFNETVKTAKLNNLREFLVENEENINQVNIITLMHRCGKQKINIFELCNIETLIKGLDVKQSGVASAQGIANALYSLQHYSDDSSRIKRLLSVLENQLDNCETPFASQAIANSFYGFKSFTWKSIESKRLLTALLRKVAKSGQIVEKPKNFVIKTQFEESENPFKLDETAEVEVEVSHPDNEIVESIPSLDKIGVPMSSQGLGSLALGIQGLKSDSPLMKEILIFLSNSLRLSSSSLDTQAVANVLLGLKSCRSEDKEVLLVLNQLSRSIAKNFNNMRRIKSQELSSKVPEVSNILNQFSDILDDLLPLQRAVSGKRVLLFGTSEEVGMLLGGMRRMSSEDKSVRRLLSHVYKGMTTKNQLISNVNTINGTSSAWFRSSNLQEQHLAGAFYGLQRMSSNTPEVRAVVGALTIAINGSQVEKKTHKKVIYPTRAGKSPFNGGNVANILYGLQNMDSNSKEVRAILRVICSKMNPIDGNFTGQHLAMSGYGLRSMSIMFSDIHGKNAVERLLINLADALEHTRHEISFSHLACMIYGLQGMSSRSASVRHLITIITERLDYLYKITSRAPLIPKKIRLSGQDVTMILQGLRSMGSEWAEIQKILQTLTNLINVHQPEMSPSQLSISFNSLRSMGGGKLIKPNRKDELQSPESYLGFMYMQWRYTGKNKQVEGLNGLEQGDDVVESENDRPQRKKYRLPKSLVNLLRALENQYLSLPNRNETHPGLPAPMAAKALYGFRGFTADTAVLRRILKLLAQDLTLSTQPLDSIAVGNGLFGLQNMTTQSETVREVLKAFSIAMGRENGNGGILPLDAQAVGNAFYGLQGMDNDFIETQMVLNELNKRMDFIHLNTHINEKGLNQNKNNEINENRYELSGQEIGNALWGLKNMSCIMNNNQQNNVLRKTIHLLAKKISSSKAELSGQHIANSLYPLHAMDDSLEEVRELLQALAFKIVNSDQPLTGLDVGMALFGLRNMDATQLEVRVILGALIQKIRKAGPDLTLQLSELTMSVVGVLQAAPWIVDDYITQLGNRSSVSTLK